MFGGFSRHFLQVKDKYCLCKSSKNLPFLGPQFARFARFWGIKNKLTCYISIYYTPNYRWANWANCFFIVHR